MKKQTFQGVISKFRECIYETYQVWYLDHKGALVVKLNYQKGKQI